MAVSNEYNGIVLLVQSTITPFVLELTEMNDWFICNENAVGGVNFGNDAVKAFAAFAAMCDTYNK